MSGRAVDAMTAAEISGLDDGIRDTVVWLRMHGFDTCDSGDGALAAEGGGEIVVHDEDCRGSAAGVGCSCAPAVHLITSTGSA